MPGARYGKGRSRLFRRRTLAPGGAVAITAADYESWGAVTETLPAGFGCASSDLDDEEVQVTGQ